MERPILASEQVYGGLNLNWEEEEEDFIISSPFFRATNLTTNNRSWVSHKKHMLN
jgi:hypothetical protein